MCIPFQLPVIFKLVDRFGGTRYVTIEWVGLMLPTPTAEWSASLEQPCRKVMVTPLLLLSSEDNLMMNCSPVCLSMTRSSTGSFGVGNR